MATKSTKAPRKATKGGLAENSQNLPAKRGRGRGRPFQPGQSGNPGGRPKLLAEVKALAAEHTKDAIKALSEIAKNPKALAVARVSAANALLDRAWGKPTQAVEMSGPDGGPVPVAAAVAPLGPEQAAELLHVLHELGQLAPQAAEGDGE